jgi:hypothetical protein
MPKADATGLAPEKSAEQNPPALSSAPEGFLLCAFFSPISMVKSRSGGLGHSNAKTARRAFRILRRSASAGHADDHRQTAKLDGKQLENLGGKERDPLHDRDRDVREGLRNRGYEVIEIQFGQLTDPDAMRQHFFRIGRFLLGKDAAQRIRDDCSWYNS